MAAHETIVASGAYTTNQGKIITVDGIYDAALIVLDVLAGSTPNLILTIGDYDTASGKTVNLLTTPTINSGTTLVRVGPDYTAGALIAKEYLPDQLSVQILASGGIAATYSLDLDLT